MAWGLVSSLFIEIVNLQQSETELKEALKTVKTFTKAAVTLTPNVI